MLPALSRIIARDVAIGLDLSDIAEIRRLPIEEVRKLTRGKLFSKAVLDIQSKLDEELCAAEVEDPVRLVIRATAKTAAIRLKEEVDNFDSDTGANSSTRIKASTAMLDMAGYGKQEVTNNLAVIMLSPDKLKSIHSIDNAALESIPDLVDGFA